MTAIFKREFKAYFITPIGYVFAALFLFFEGSLFGLLYSDGSPYVERVIMSMFTVIVFVLPILTMKMLSDDKRQKVDQVLLTAPVTVTGIIFGKFLAALCVFAIAFAPTVVFKIIVSAYVSVNWLEFIYCLIGIILLGSAMISIGMFISSLTESSVVAAILTIVINLFVMTATSLASTIKYTWVTTLAQSISFFDRFDNFGNGILSIADIVYFLSITAIFIFLSVRSLEKRRWA